MSSLINIANSMKDVEPMSVIQSAMVAAALDLPIDRNLGFAWIVPFKNKGQKQAQFQMGFKGFVQLGLRSGQYKRMNARAINEEAFKGYDDVGEPVIDWQEIDEAKPTHGYVFAFQLVNGFTKCAFWKKTRVEEHAKRYSQSFRGGYDSPWKSHFDEMALKTVIKNELSRWGILSIDMQSAIEKDQAVVDTDGSVSFLDNAQPGQTLDGPSFEPKLLPPEQDNSNLELNPVKESAPEPPKAPPAPAIQPNEAAKPIPAPHDTTKTEKPPESPLADLEAAMTEGGISSDQLLAFAKKKGVLKEGADADLAVLSDIMPSKVPTLAKMIRTKGAAWKEMGEATYDKLTP